MIPPPRGVLAASCLLLLGACSSEDGDGPTEAEAVAEAPPIITDLSVRRGGDTVYASMVAPDAVTSRITSEPDLLSAVGTNSARAEGAIRFRRSQQEHTIRFTARNGAGEVSRTRSVTVEADRAPIIEVEGLEGLVEGLEGTVQVEIDDDVGLEGTVTVTWDNSLDAGSFEASVDTEDAFLEVPVIPRRPGLLNFRVATRDRVGSVELATTAQVRGAPCPPPGPGAGSQEGTGAHGAAPLPVELAEPVMLDRLQAQCMRLAPGSYALAYLDDRFMEPGSWQPDWRPQDPPDPFSVTVGSAGHVPPGSAVPQALRTPPPLQGHDPHTHPTPVPDGAWQTTESPWSWGDTIPYDNGRTVREGVIVLDILHDLYVLAYPVGRPITQTLQAELEAMIDRLDREVLPRLEGLLGASPGAPNGQYLVVAVLDGEGRGISAVAGREFMELTLGTGQFDADAITETYRTFTHELVHSVDLRARDHLQKELGSSLEWGIWHVEGLADHLAYRVAAESVGLPLGADLPRGPATAVVAPVVDGGMELESGYHHAAGLSWYLAGEIARATGMEWGAAHDTVSVAMWKGRWGCLVNGDCTSVDGLYDVVRHHLGGDWDPVEGTLTYLLSQALDNMTGNPSLQNIHVDRARFGPTHAFHSDAPEARSFTHDAGSGGYVTLEVSEESVFQALGSREDVRWMLVRYR